jgi:hypothetical protein
MHGCDTVHHAHRNWKHQGNPKEDKKLSYFSGVAGRVHMFGWILFLPEKKGLQGLLLVPNHQLSTAMKRTVCKLMGSLRTEYRCTMQCTANLHGTQLPSFTAVRLYYSGSCTHSTISPLQVRERGLAFFSFDVTWYYRVASCFLPLLQIRMLVQDTHQSLSLSLSNVG